MLTFALIKLYIIFILKKKKNEKRFNNDRFKRFDFALFLNRFLVVFQQVSSAMGSKFDKLTEIICFILGQLLTLKKGPKNEQTESTSLYILAWELSVAQGTPAVYPHGFIGILCFLNLESLNQVKNISVGLSRSEIKI